MKQKILKFSFSRLRKLEAVELTSRIIKITERHNPILLDLTASYNKLANYMPCVNMLTLEYGPHPLTANIDKLRKKRLIYAQAIIDRVKKMYRIDDRDTDAALAYAMPLTKLYLNKLGRKNDVAIYMYVEEFCNEVVADEKIVKAFESLHVIYDFEQLKHTNQEIHRLIGERNKSMLQRPKHSNREILANLKTLLHNLFNQIEVEQIVNRHLDYATLINELNYEIGTIKAQLKARCTRSKNREKKKKLQSQKTTQAKPLSNAEIVRKAMKLSDPRYRLLRTVFDDDDRDTYENDIDADTDDAALKPEVHIVDRRMDWLPAVWSEGE